MIDLSDDFDVVLAKFLGPAAASTEILRQLPQVLWSLFELNGLRDRNGGQLAATVAGQDDAFGSFWHVKLSTDPLGSQQGRDGDWKDGNIRLKARLRGEVIKDPP